MKACIIETIPAARFVMAGNVDELNRLAPWLAEMFPCSAFAVRLAGDGVGLPMASHWVKGAIETVEARRLLAGGAA